jgi:hypothetical protein
MRALLSYLMLAVMAISMMACQPDKSSSRTTLRNGRAARGNSEFYPNGVPNQNQNLGIPQNGQTSSTRPYSPTTGAVWGAMYGQGYFSDDQYNSFIHDFVSSTMDSSQLGTVSGNLSDATGVRFWGHVETSSGFNPNGSTNSTIRSTNAILRVVIWDSYAGQVDSNGNLVPEYPVDMRTVQGEVNGNTARIRFSDQYGWIELSGTFDAQYFTGTAWFDNNGGAANYLGVFYVSTCGFFKCY